MTSNGNQLFVADSYNNRMLIWNTIPTANGVPADVVLGQPDFTTSTAASSINGLDAPSGIHVAGSQVIVTDSVNYRFLIFQGN